MGIILATSVSGVYEAYFLMEIFWILVVASLLALIPANIARKKGHSFGLWWLYGFALWIVAFIHSLCLKNDVAKGRKRNEERQRYELEETKLEMENKAKRNLSKPDLLIKYKQLLDEGVLTQDEFEKEKKKILEM